MTYWWLDLVFLGLAIAVLLVALRVSRRPVRALIARWGAPIAIACVTVLVLTAVFDNIMISSGLATYAMSAISGLLVGTAPLEDFAYPVAGAILLPSLWLLFGRRGARGR